jgi:ribose/xylose/arabinose/galactoside ABC-type transport system permease subunit
MQADTKLSPIARAYNSVGTHIGLVVGFCLLIITLSFLSDRFFTPQNLINIVRQASINGVIAIGMAMVVLTAGIDLSVGSLLGFTAVLQAMLLSAGVSPWIVIIVGLCSGAVLGCVNGLFITRIGIPPFIATLGMMVLMRGTTLIISGGKPISGLPDPFRFFGAGTIGILPVPVILVVVLYAIGIVVLRRTVVGERIYAIGDNVTAARFVNIPVRFYVGLTYAISGLMCTIAGIMLVGRLNSAQPTIGQGYEFDAIAAVVIGGVSLSGGTGGLGGVFIGALIIAVINNGLNILNVSSLYQQVVKGIVIVLTLIAYNALRRNQK